MRKKLFAALLTLCLTLSAALPAAALELEDAKGLLQAYYVDQIPEDVLAMDSLEDILEALGDPYTVYMDAEEYQNFLASVNGDSVVGIGVSVEKTFRDGHQILSILPDSPALEAGLEAGDRIVAVDGAELTDSMEITARIGGEEGTPVTVTVIRGADGSRQDFVMNRRKVDIPIVTYKTVDGAGYINCISFGASTASTIREALEKENEHVNVWILDLRSNPGGTSTAACDAAGLFAGPGVMVSFSDAYGNTSGTYTRAADLTDKPLIVLTGPYSASGSELFAAAARDYGFGIAVGERTFGKGIAQFVLDGSNAPDYFDGDCLKITAYRFYSPDGTTNHAIGILPTLTISKENAEKAAMLLTCPYSDFPENHLLIGLAEQTFVVDLGKALEEENKAAFTELLEALPPSAGLSYGDGKTGADGREWHAVTPSELAELLRLRDFVPRTFSDAADSPFRSAIDTLAVHNLLEGYDDGSFRPENTITRAEFAAMVSTALGLPDGKTASFSDVKEDDWFAGAVSAMISKGFLAGYEDGTFRPHETITYEQMVTVLASVAAWANLDAARLADTGVPVADYMTYAAYSDWAMTPARVLDELDALTGEQAPGDAGTRETAAGLLFAMMKSIHLIWE